MRWSRPLWNKNGYFRNPNGGKSRLFKFLGNHCFCGHSIFNRPSLFLKSQPHSINCNSHPSKTRDVLELALDIGGLPVIVADTFDLRVDVLVEGIGVQWGIEESVFFALILDLFTDYNSGQNCGRSALRARSPCLKSSYVFRPRPSRLHINWTSKPHLVFDTF